MTVFTVYEIGGLAITILAALLSYLRSPDDAKKQNAALVSLIGTVFTMLISLRFSVMPQIESHLLLAEKINKTPRVLEMVDGIADAVKIADGAGNPLMRSVLRARLDSIEREMNLVTQGTFEVSNDEIPQFALELIKSAKLSFIATSYVRAADWWNTPWGKQYEALNYVARKNGVKIVRIFIFSTDGEKLAAESYLNLQEKNGIEVWTAMASDLTSKVTSDMVVMDDQLAGELTLTPDKGIQSARFMTNRQAIDEVKRRFESLQASAERVDTKIKNVLQTAQPRLPE
jgi:hypothetical protein